MHRFPSHKVSSKVRSPQPSLIRHNSCTDDFKSFFQGTSITNLADYAQDDEGDVITYSLDTVGQSYCNVDSVSGLVTLKKALDREVKLSCHLYHINPNVSEIIGRLQSHG